MPFNVAFIISRLVKTLIDTFTVDSWLVDDDEQMRMSINAGATVSKKYIPRNKSL